MVASSATSLIFFLFLRKGEKNTHNGETRWRQFLGSGSQAAAEFSSEYETGKSTHATLVCQTNQEPDSEGGIK